MLKQLAVIAIVVSAVPAIAHSDITHREVTELVKVRDCHGAIVRLRTNPGLAYSIPFFRYKLEPAIPQNPQVGSYTYTRAIMLELDPDRSVTTVFEFHWPNMSAEERSANSAHLPALRAHEEGHYSVAQTVLEEMNKQPPIINGTGENAEEARNDFEKQKELYLQNEYKRYSAKVNALNKPKQDEYDRITVHGTKQSRWKEGGEDVAYDCGLHVRLAEVDYKLGVAAASNQGNHHAVATADESYRAYDDAYVISSLSDLVNDEADEAQDGSTLVAEPVVTGSRVSDGRVVLAPEMKGKTLALGEDIDAKSDCRESGATAASHLSVSFSSPHGEFWVQGNIGVSAGSAGLGTSGIATLNLDLKLYADGPAQVHVTNCDLFDKELFAKLGGNFSEKGGECSFQMAQLASTPLVGGFFSLMRFNIEAEAKASNPPIVPAVPGKPRIDKPFTIRVIYDRNTAAAK